MSYHEYVPGMKDLRGTRTGSEGGSWSNSANASREIESVKNTVLNPLKSKGMTMGDVSGERGTNWGNVAQGADGKTKIVDFLPVTAGRPMPASQSFAKYAPMPTLRHSEEGGGTVGDLRKEMYKPTMQSRPATEQQVRNAVWAHGNAAREGTGPATPVPAPKPTYSAVPDPFKSRTSPVSGTGPTAPQSTAEAPTLAPSARAPRPAPMSISDAAGTAPATPRARSSGVPHVPISTARPIPSRTVLPTRAVLGGLHR